MKALRKDEGRWYLVTGRGTSLAVRDVAQKRKLSREEADRILSRTAPEDALWEAADLRHPHDPDLLATKIPVDDIETWRQLAEGIDRGDVAKVSRDRPMVPITPLRDVCGILRLLATQDTYRKLARSWLDEPVNLARLFLRSVADFEEYENEEESFIPEGRSGVFLDRTEGRFARDLVHAASAKGHLHIGGHDFGYVDYEVSPRRTTRALLEGGDKASKSGAGGIDLLLTDGQVVGVAEVKSEKDMPLLVALVQVLMYASELASAAQQRRLARRYEQQLGFLGRADATRASMDLLILYQGQSRHVGEVEQVGDIARALLHDNRLATDVRKHVRRILFARAGGDDFTFEVDREV